jgi:hypothetical protein
MSIKILDILIAPPSLLQALNNKDECSVKPRCSTLLVEIIGQLIEKVHSIYCTRFSQIIFQGLSKCHFLVSTCEKINLLISSRCCIYRERRERRFFGWRRSFLLSFS